MPRTLRTRTARTARTETPATEPEVTETPATEPEVTETPKEKEIETVSEATEATEATETPALSVEDIQKFQDPLTGEAVFRLNGEWFDSEIAAKASLYEAAAKEAVSAYITEIYGPEGEDESRSDKRARTQATNFALAYEKWRLASAA